MIVGVRSGVKVGFGFDSGVMSEGERGGQE